MASDDETEYISWGPIVQSGQGSSSWSGTGSSSSASVNKVVVRAVHARGKSPYKAKRQHPASNGKVLQPRKTPKLSPGPGWEAKMVRLSHGPNSCHWISPTRKIEFRYNKPACKFEELRKKFGADEVQAWKEYRRTNPCPGQTVVSPQKYDDLLPTSATAPLLNTVDDQKSKTDREVFQLLARYKELGRRYDRRKLPPRSVNNASPGQDSNPPESDLDEETEVGKPRCNPPGNIVFRSWSLSL